MEKKFELIQDIKWNDILLVKGTILFEEQWCNLIDRDFSVGIDLTTSDIKWWKNVEEKEEKNPENKEGSLVECIQDLINKQLTIINEFKKEINSFNVLPLDNENIPEEKEEEEKKYPILGYAPGNYYCTCIECLTMFQGDKRSVHCENCAIRLSKENEEESINKKVKEILIKYGIKSLGQKIGVLDVQSLMFKIAKQQTETLYNEEQVYKILQELRLEIKSGVQKWQEDFEFDLENWFENNKKNNLTK
jgi:hypothetical protein